MSTTIESRVVEMRFDNSNFEKNVSQSMNTLEALKKNLNFNNAAESFGAITKAAQNVDVSSVSESVSKLHSGFSAMEMVALSAISNITNRLVNMGLSMTKALTIEPVMTGFSEYETKIGSIQTILANTSHAGTTLKDVNKALDELNEYSDKTIYNFTEMTRNIGTFTAAGIDLKTSTQAIKGIANLAAVSGSTSQQASTAMYQLSQALAAGKVSLMDWNSVVNAGMGGKVFQDALIRTSEVLGTGAKKAIEANGSFRESLTKSGWLTNEVLTTTLNQFAGAYDEAQLKAKGFNDQQIKDILKIAKTAEDAATIVKTGTMLMDTLKEEAQSGWTETWQIVIGDFEEAKKFWTGINKIISPAIAKSAKLRNDMLTIWKEAGGRDDMVKSIKVVLKSVLDVQEAITGGIRDAFPIDGKKLAAATKSIREFLQWIKPTKDTLEGIRGTVRGLASILKPFLAIAGALVKIAFTIAGALIKVAGGILQLTGRFGNLVGDVVDAGMSFEWFGKIVDTLCGWITKAGTFLADLLHKLKEKINFGDWEKSTSIFEKMKNAIDKVKDSLKVVTDFISNTWSKFIQFMTEGEMPDFVGVFKAIGSGIVSVFHWIASAAQAVWAKLDEWGIVDVLKIVWEHLKLIGTAIKDQIVGGLERMGQGDFSTLLELLALVAGVLTGKKINDMTGAVEGLVKNISKLFDKKNVKFFKEWLEGLISPLKALSTKIKSEALWNIAKSIALLSASLFLLALVDDGKLLKVTGVITALVVDLLGAMKALSTIGTFKVGSMIAVVLGLVGIASALLILAAAIKMLASLKPEDMWGSVAAVLLIVMALVKMVEHLTGAGTLNKGQTLKAAAALKALKSLAISVLILCAAIAILAKYEPQQLIPAVVAVMFLIAELTLAMRVLNKTPEPSTKAIFSMIAFAFSLTKLAKTVKMLGSIDLANLAQGMGTLTVLIGMLLAMMYVIKKKALGDGEGFKKSIITMLALSASLLLLAESLWFIGKMDFGQIVKGLIGLGGCMAILVTSLKSLKDVGGKDAIVISAALAVMSASLIPLALGLRAIGSIDFWSLLKGVAALYVCIKVMSDAIKKLESINSVKGAVSMVILAAAINELAIAFLMFNGVSFKALLVGLGAIVGVLVALGAATYIMQPAMGSMREMAITMLIASAAVAALALAFDILVGVLLKLAALSAKTIVSIATSFKNLALIFISFIPELGTALLTALGALLPTIGGLIKDTIMTLLGLISDLAGPIIETLLGVLIDILGAIEGHISTIVDKVMSIIIKVIDGIAARTPELIQSLVNLLMAIIDGLITAINSNSISFDKLLEALSIVGLMLLTAAGFVVTGALAAAGLIIAAVAVAELIAFLAALGAINQIPGLAWFVEEGGKLLSVIATAIGNFIGNLIGSAVESFSSHLDGIGNNLVDFINCFSGIDRSVIESIDILAGAMLKLAAGDFLDAIASWIRGSSNMSTFGDTIANFGEGFKKFSESISDLDPSTVVKVKMAADSISILATACKDIPTEGGVWGFLFGNVGYDDFIGNLSKLGSGLNDFNTNLGSNFDTARATAAADALSAIAKGTNLIPKEGGILQLLLGHTDFDGFIENLPGLGTAVSDFAKNAGDVKKGAVNGAKALEAICRGVNQIPATDGLLQGLLGSVKLDNFKDQLPNLGTGIAQFTKNVSGEDVDLNTAMTAANVLESVCTAVSNIPTEGGFLSWMFSGDVSLEKFASQMPLLAQGIASFASILSGSEVLGVTITNPITEDMLAMADKAVQLVGSIGEVVGAVPDNIKDVMNKVSDAIGTLNNAINNVSVTDEALGSVTSIKDYLDTLMPAFKQVSDIDMDKISGLDANLGAIANNSVTSFTKPFDNAEKKVREAGSKLVEWLQAGLAGLAKSSSVASTASNLASSAVSGFKSQYLAAFTAGKYLADGLISGAVNKQGELYDIGIWMANQVLGGIKSKKGADEHSPSKKTELMGNYLAEGLINGMTDYSDKIQNAGVEMGSVATDGVSTAISNISKIISGEVDTNPTIRPVLDLSDISAKASAINGLLGDHSINARIGGIASSMGRAKVDSTNADVVRAINKLEETLNGTPNNTYNINGITYSGDSDITDAVTTLVRAARIGGRV